MGCPLKVTLPRRGRMRPERVFMRVDLPAPFGPRMATTSPASARNSAFQRIW